MKTCELIKGKVRNKAEREGERCLGGLVAKRREESGGGGGASLTRSKLDDFRSPETLLTALAIDTKCNSYADLISPFHFSLYLVIAASKRRRHKRVPWLNL